LEDILGLINEELSDYMGKEISVSKRTLFGDLKYMKDDSNGFNAPIHYSKELGYHYTVDGFSIYNTDIKKSDLEILKDTIATLSHIADKAQFDDLKGVINRLESTYNISYDENTAPILYFEESLNIEGQKWINNLKQAIRKKQVMRVQYRPFDKEPYLRYVSPWFLKEYNNRWFLFGYQHAEKKDSYEGITNLALDRIVEISPSIKPYHENADTSPETLLNKVIGVSISDGPIEHIRFKIYGTRRHYAATKPIHKSQNTVTASEDYTLFSIDVIPNFELETKFLSFGPDLEVISPATLRDQLKEKIKAMERVYGK
jgi:predicted DNA-binding transcriptional regulator YafY